MENIMTYLKWRSDLTLSECPFCEVDNLVLSELNYMNLSAIIFRMGKEDDIAVEKAAEFYVGDEYPQNCACPSGRDMLEVMAASYLEKTKKDLKAIFMNQNHLPNYGII
ncbi:hypothetical protein [Clostridium neonatale]|uniref:hypothetical protein n=1 Tax=Clostridium neonatale TaxID=137838 RepID=UPI001E31F50B|nr:hypothetical protein [Clostridium neonatale]